MTNEYFTTLKSCRSCGSEKFKEFINLGNQSITSSFPRSDEPDPGEAPLVLIQCQECNLLQLKHTVNADLMYSEQYGYRSSINESMIRHLKGLTSFIEDNYKLKEGDIILDIGCNDGTLLKSYTTKNLKRLGIDPIAHHFAKYYPKDIKTLGAYFDKLNFQKLASKSKAKVITSISMFYDLPNPLKFARDISDCLDEDGIWILEQSYLPTMIEMNSFDTICHEHLEYYDLRSISYILEKSNLKIIDVTLNETNGGSFRLFVTHSNSTKYKVKESVNDLATSEKLFFDSNLYNSFQERIHNLKLELKNFIINEMRKGKVFFIYGASTKGNTLLQYFELDNKMFPAAAERNPDKFGKVTPGTRIPIISESEARARKPDYFLVLPWHFKESIIVREKEFLENGGTLIFPLPSLSFVKK